jgi:hypothetical protein
MHSCRRLKNPLTSGSLQDREILGHSRPTACWSLDSKGLPAPRRAEAWNPRNTGPRGAEAWNPVNYRASRHAEAWNPEEYQAHGMLKPGIQGILGPWDVHAWNSYKDRFSTNETDLKLLITHFSFVISSPSGPFFESQTSFAFLVFEVVVCVPWRWRRYVPLKRRFTQDLHGAISQKTAFFIAVYVAH